MTSSRSVQSQSQSIKFPNSFSLTPDTRVQPATLRLHVTFTHSPPLPRSENPRGASPTTDPGTGENCCPAVCVPHLLPSLIIIVISKDQLAARDISRSPELVSGPPYMVAESRRLPSGLGGTMVPWSTPPHSSSVSHAFRRGRHVIVVNQEEHGSLSTKEKRWDQSVKVADIKRTTPALQRRIWVWEKYMSKNQRRCQRICKVVPIKSV